MVVQRIRLTGDYDEDFAEANRLAGFVDASAPLAVAKDAHRSLRVPGSNTIGYVWHHVEDVEMSRNGTLILVRADIHNSNIGGVAHTGGTAIYREQFNGGYE